MENKWTGRNLREVETKGVKLRSLKEKYHTGEGHTLDTSYNLKAQLGLQHRELGGWKGTEIAQAEMCSFTDPFPYPISTQHPATPQPPTHKHTPPVRNQRLDFLDFEWARNWGWGVAVQRQRRSTPKTAYSG